VLQIESSEKKVKAMPSKIKRLLPSPGSVLRHTGVYFLI
jgi:hypothetical protein